MLITEDFDYEKITIAKDTPCELLDLKIVNYARTGIGALIRINLDKSAASDPQPKWVNKAYIEDWVDLALIFPLKNHFTVPHGVEPEEYRVEHMDKEDKKLIDSFKDMIINGEKEKVIKSISTRLASSKFGL